MESIIQYFCFSTLLGFRAFGFAGWGFVAGPGREGFALPCKARAFGGKDFPGCEYRGP